MSPSHGRTASSYPALSRNARWLRCWIRRGRSNTRLRRCQAFQQHTATEGDGLWPACSQKCINLVQVFAKYLDRSFLPSPSMGEGEGGGAAGARPYTPGHAFPPIPPVPRDCVGGGAPV